ncbi:MAG TPA: RDD family protein, partial [Acidimicrobiales bacterium]|nr:RDD family protein [Acidimicrobiales bacterium]
MSAYPFPAASPSVPTATAADPTAVFGRRVAAIVIDLLLLLIVMSFVTATPLSPLAEFYRIPDSISRDDACDGVRDLEDDVATCVPWGDRAYFIDSTDAVVAAVVLVAFIGLYAAAQGATGRTPGKALLAIKAVDERGGRPGFGRSLGRTLLWVIDAAPWCLPLVGFITGLTTNGHRRVGDMACKTFVVGKRHLGPVVVPGLPGAGGHGTPGAPAWAAPGAQSGPA